MNRRPHTVGGNSVCVCHCVHVSLCACVTVCTCHCVRVCACACGGDVPETGQNRTGQDVPETDNHLCVDHGHHREEASAHGRRAETARLLHAHNSTQHTARQHASTPRVRREDKLPMQGPNGTHANPREYQGRRPPARPHCSPIRVRWKAESTWNRCCGNKHVCRPSLSFRTDHTAAGKAMVACPALIENDWACQPQLFLSVRTIVVPWETSVLPQEQAPHCTSLYNASLLPAYLATRTRKQCAHTCSFTSAQSSFFNSAMVADEVSSD